jgi:hypothetical protein
MRELLTVPSWMAERLQQLPEGGFGASLTAIPVFTRRLYSQSQMYVNTAAGINEPRDFIGKRVGLGSFRTTLSVLAKGDLQHEYGVPPPHAQRDHTH